MDRTPAPPKGNPSAIVSLAAGVAAVLASLFVSIIVGGILALVALLAGGFGRGQAKKGLGGDGMAIGGMILGGISVAINVIVPNLID